MTPESTTFNYHDPYPYYRHLREHSPYYRDSNGVYYLSRYDDVKLALEDPRFARAPSGGQGFFNHHTLDTRLENILSRWLMLNDPPRHTHLRKLLSTLFDASFIKNTKTLMESIAEETLLSMLQNNEVDFMQSFAYPYAVTIINRLLGVDLDINITRKWSLCVSTTLDHGTEEDYKNLAPHLLEMYDFFSKLIKDRRTPVDSHWLDQLIYFEKSKQLSHDDVVSSCIFLLLTGHETVQLTLGLGVMTLLKNPYQLHLLQIQPELIPFGIEEILRYESPFSLISRWTTESIVLNHLIIPKNTLVVSIINSANRDESKFSNANMFDVRRNSNKHLALGRGIHQCLGGLLSRIELNTAFVKLIPILHFLRLEENSIAWFPIASFRYLHRLPLQILPRE